MLRFGAEIAICSKGVGVSGVAFVRKGESEPQKQSLKKLRKRRRLGLYKGGNQRERLRGAEDGLVRRASMGSGCRQRELPITLQRGVDSARGNC